MLSPTRKTQDKLSDGGEIASWPAGALGKKNSFLYDRSHYVYENKQKDDNLPDKKAVISARMT